LVALGHEQVLTDGRKLAEDFLNKTQARFEAGTVPKLDTIKAKVDLAEAVNELIANERNTATARATLNRLLVRPQGAPIEPADPLDVPAPLADITALEKLALASRPELLSNAADRESARQSTRLASNYWLPDVGLTLSRNYTAGDPAAYSTAASINLPLFFWQHNKGEIAEAKHREAELAATANDLTAQVNLDVRSAYASASTTIRQAIYIRDELLPEAREAFQIASTSYGLGGSSALDLLDAKRTMLDAENQYADALGAANDAVADLEKAVGASLPTATGATNEK
jgi:cobalt-zinc-cadmium efflux system outer membrane protein